ncbi:34295_t:CDS:2, partial [Racocetra persica]
FVFILGCTNSVSVTNSGFEAELAFKRMRVINRLGIGSYQLDT